MRVPQQEFTGVEVNLSIRGKPRVEGELAGFLRLCNSNLARFGISTI